MSIAALEEGGQRLGRYERGENLLAGNTPLESSLGIPSRSSSEKLDHCQLCYPCQIALSATRPSGMFCQDLYIFQVRQPQDPQYRPLHIPGHPCTKPSRQSPYQSRPRSLGQSLRRCDLLVRDVFDTDNSGPGPDPFRPCASGPGSHDLSCPMTAT